MMIRGDPKYKEIYDKVGKEMGAELRQIEELIREWIEQNQIIL